MSKKRKTISFTISVFAIIIAIVHIIFPNLKIDGITLMLIILAVIPWLYPLFKSLELPGGFKFEFQELEKVTETAKEVGLISKEQKIFTKDYSFLAVANEDPGLALAGLRIEIEKRLRNIAKRNNIYIGRKGLNSLLQILSQNYLLSSSEESVLRDMVVTLNQASHGHDIDSRISDWLFEYGPKLLENLDGKSYKKVEAKNTTSPYDMSAWGHEKTERILGTIARQIDYLNKNQDVPKEIKEEINQYISEMLYNITKMYSFYCDYEWSINDSELIRNEGTEGLKKLIDKYNREFHNSSV